MVDEQRIVALFPSFERDLVEGITEHAAVREFPEGSLIMKTGQHFRATMLILEGVVKIYREDDAGNEVFMYYLGPGQACALSMICMTRHETSEIMARADTRVETLSIPLEWMDKWMTQYRSWYHFVLENYRARFEELLVTIDDIAFRSMDQRLLSYLQKQRDLLGTSRFPVSITDIAADLNSSREVVSRLLKKLAEKGNIRMEKNMLEIVRIDD